MPEFFSDFNSFYPIYIDNRDFVKRNLKLKNVFLPKFWPNRYNIKNTLYDKLLCVPVDLRYNEETLARYLEIIKKELEKKS